MQLKQLKMCTRTIYIYRDIYKLPCTYVDARNGSLHHRRLEENLSVDEAEIVVKLGDGAGEDPLSRLAGALEKRSRYKLANLRIPFQFRLDGEVEVIHSRQLTGGPCP